MKFLKGMMMFSLAVLVYLATPCSVKAEGEIQTGNQLEDVSVTITPTTGSSYNYTISVPEATASNYSYLCGYQHFKAGSTPENNYVGFDGAVLLGDNTGGDIKTSSTTGICGSATDISTLGPPSITESGDLYAWIMVQDTTLNSSEVQFVYGIWWLKLGEIAPLESPTVTLDGSTLTFTCVHPGITGLSYWCEVTTEDGDEICVVSNTELSGSAGETITESFDISIHGEPLTADTKCLIVVHLVTSYEQKFTRITNGYETEETVTGGNESSSSNESSESSEEAPVAKPWQPTTPDEIRRFAMAEKADPVVALAGSNAYPVTVKNAVQGTLCVAVMELYMGEGYTLGRTYDIMPNNKMVYNMDGSVTITMQIPDSISADGRTYEMVCVSEDGMPSVLKDQDNDPTTITFTTDKFYAFGLCYRD
ncbi:MAG: hypothetical protein R3Y24_16525 [Eubacteriales bacterium]